MIILYDSNCSICTQIKKILGTIDFDHAFNFIPISDHEIYEKYPQVNYWSARKTIHLIDSDGQVYSSEYAVLKILDQIRFISKASPLLKTKIGIKLTALSYKLLNNYRLKKMKNCNECRP